MSADQAVPPSGVVTFLFTDVEGSSRRWEADADGMRKALAAHDKVLRTAIEAHDGFLFSHTGDGFVAPFASPMSAVNAAIDAQRELQLPVRMGLATGGLPQLDVARVQRWCDSQVPQHIRNEIRIECDVIPRHLTICECRPPWREDLGPDWIRFPIARLHYTKTTGLWTLYWRDHNLKYHHYQPLDPSPRVQDLLDYLDSRADPIFWG